jgi:hypothetical protein
MPAHALLPAVKRLLQQEEQVSGLPVAVAEQSDLSTLATLRPAPPAPGAPGRLPRCRSGQQPPRGL